MSFSERPQAWCTPMGLLAVMGPSRNDQGGPPAVCARSFRKIWRSSQKRRSSRSIAGKSGTLGTGRYIFILETKRQKGSKCRKIYGNKMKTPPVWDGFRARHADNRRYFSSKILRRSREVFIALRANRAARFRS